MVDTCPICGAVRSPPDLFATSPVKHAIYDFMRTHAEPTRAEIEAYVYNGVPRSNTAISAQMSQMRPTLWRHGLALICIGGTPRRYCLKLLERRK